MWFFIAMLITAIILSSSIIFINIALSPELTFVRLFGKATKNRELYSKLPSYNTKTGKKISWRIYINDLSEYDSISGKKIRDSSLFFAISTNSSFRSIFPWWIRIYSSSLSRMSVLVYADKIDAWIDIESKKCYNYKDGKWESIDKGVKNDA